MLTDKVPEDKHNIVYYSFMYLGICALVPWSALLNAFDFFVWKMPGYAPENTYPFANYFLVVITQVWLITTGDRFTYATRLIVSFGFAAIILAIIPFLAYLPDTINYWVIFVVLMPFGGFCGMSQGTVYTMAA